LRRIVLVVVVLAAAVVAVAIGLPALGTWLVVADPLVASDAIFVLEGRTPSREVEAAALYHRRLAPVVGLSRARDPLDVARALARLPPRQHIATGVLTNVGVPERAILRLDREARNTAEELAVIRDAARASGFRRIIIVTSPSHTRRVRIIWDAQRSDIQAVIHPSPFETFDARRWWRSRHGVEAMFHELGGIVNFQLGSVLPTFDDETR
jgi:uncharacterized SAM-binding protein YcdF (DUF218 family)